MQDPKGLASALVDRHPRDDALGRQLEDLDAQLVGEATRRQRVEDGSGIGLGAFRHDFGPLSWPYINTGPSASANCRASAYSRRATRFRPSHSVGRTTDMPRSMRPAFHSALTIVAGALVIPS